MSSGEPLDQLVKGAAPPGLSTPKVIAGVPPQAPEPDIKSPRASETPPQDDPEALLPSAPPQIYLNLLILEASLRSQYLLLRARRRQNAFFLALLAAWNGGFAYLLFLQPREDGRGRGGSVYWVVDGAYQGALLGGAVTAALVWGTGQWERGVRWPRRFVGVANRGLRAMNCKIVVLRRAWWRELLSHFAFLVPFPAAPSAPDAGYQFDAAPRERRAPHGPGRPDEAAGILRGEDLTPGGDHIKLLLLPKPFSPAFRENWETYRAEYWAKENERRAALRRQWKAQERRRAREEGGVFWWMAWPGRRPGRPPHHETGLPPAAPSRAAHERDLKVPAARRGMHSREPSRSSTPGVEGDERPPSRSSHHGAAGAAAEGKRRTRASGLGISQQQPKQGRTALQAARMA